MRRFGVALAILLSAAILVQPDVKAAPAGQGYLIYSAFLKAESAQDRVEHIHRDAIDYPSRRGMTADRLVSLYEDLMGDSLAAADAANDALDAASDANSAVLSAGKYELLACVSSIMTYAAKTAYAAIDEHGQLSLARDVIIAGGTTQQVLDTIKGEPAATSRRVAADAKSPARRCTG